MPGSLKGVGSSISIDVIPWDVLMSRPLSRALYRLKSWPISRGVALICSAKAAARSSLSVINANTMTPLCSHTGTQRSSSIRNLAQAGQCFLTESLSVLRQLCVPQLQLNSISAGLIGGSCSYLLLEKFLKTWTNSFDACEPLLELTEAIPRL